MKNIFKKVLLGGAVLFLCLSLALNYIFYKADIEYWLAYKRIEEIESVPSPILGSVTQFHDELTRGSLEFLKNEKRLKLPQYEDVSFWQRLKSGIKKEKEPIMGIIHAEQDGFMFLELLEDAITKDDKDRVEYLKSYFDSHTLNLPFEHRDQSVEVISSLRLYDYTGENKYKLHADKMYEWLLSQNSEYGILYVPGLKSSIVDVLGMIVPFLVEYSKTFNKPEAYNLALQQIEIYTKYGCDKETGMPAFAYNIDSPHIKIGRMNWGRGVSWYVIGLSYIDVTRLSLESQETINRLNNTLSAIWNINHRFDHFIEDHTKKSEMDLTAELPILYYLKKNGIITLSQKKILEYSQYMHDGIMYNCSNSNSGIVEYGIAHGPMMLAQAFMLRLTKRRR